MRIVGRGPDLTVLEESQPGVHLGFHRLAIVMVRIFYFYKEKNAAVVHCSILRSYKKMYDHCCASVLIHLSYSCLLSLILSIFIFHQLIRLVYSLFYKLFFDAQLMSLSI